VSSAWKALALVVVIARIAVAAVVVAATVQDCGSLARTRASSGWKVLARAGDIVQSVEDNLCMYYTRSLRVPS
jgi:hypothetical protein